MLNITGRVANNMGRINPVLIVVLMSCASLSGCIFSSKEDSSIDLEVGYDITNGTIIETYYEGQLDSTTVVSIAFDFSQTSSFKSLKTFGIDFMDGSEPITTDTSMPTIIANFSNHGIYDITAFAIDSSDYQQNLTIPIKIDLRIEWLESETNDPIPLQFNPIPNNQGKYPTMIEIISHVENPSLIDGIGDSGQSIQLTWYLIDELDDICQSRNGQANDGDTIMWQTIYFNTYMKHELRINLDDDRDSININQSVSILYD